jgi:hypothetical protein
MGMNPIIAFHAQVYIYCKGLWFFGMINEAYLEFLQETMFVGSLLHITIIVQDGHQILELYIVVAEFLISLGELI